MESLCVNWTGQTEKKKELYYLELNNSGSRICYDTSSHIILLLIALCNVCFFDKKIKHYAN